jgi:sterol desaturase/sphingolipid hydroxylase (fatty acid hydroxylase superfamily)
MTALTGPLLAFALGGLGWTLAEYGLHRFVFHGASARRLGAGEHRRHHAEVDYFAPWWQKALAALAVTAAMLPLAIALSGTASGLAFTAGFVVTYLSYEVLHRTAHTRPPRGRYGRWRRRNHFAHHFMDPRRAQGVTTPLWDQVFGTRLPVDRVRVPRRLALPWLLDARGEIHPAYAEDYELVGSARSDAATRRSDADAARANRAPSLESG